MAAGASVTLSAFSRLSTMAAPERFTSTQLADGQFYGAINGAARCSGLVFSEVVHNHAVRVPEHSHRLAYFALVLDGHYEEGQKNRLVPYGPYNLIFNPTGVEHEGMIGSKGSKFFTVELGDHWLRPLENESLHYCYSDMNGGRLLWLAMRLRQEYAANHLAEPLAAECLVWEMLGEITRWNHDSAPQRPVWWRRLEDTIRSSFREKLSFSAIAHDLGIHPVHLARTCRRVENRTLGEYVQSLRVRYSCERLKDRDTPLAELAFDAGFSDQSHFTRIFRRFVGITPARYRDSLTS
jgi:AraC family transcriptional regulator